VSDGKEWGEGEDETQGERSKRKGRGKKHEGNHLLCIMYGDGGEDQE